MIHTGQRNIFWSCLNYHSHHWETWSIQCRFQGYKDIYSPSDTKMHTVICASFLQFHIHDPHRTEKYSGHIWITTAVRNRLGPEHPGACLKDCTIDYNQLILKKNFLIWNWVDCQCSEKDPKHTRDYRERFLIRQNRTKHANFRGSPLFQAMYNIKTKKQTINSLSLCQLDAGGMVEGKGHKTQCLWHKLSELIVFLFSCCT